MSTITRMINIAFIDGQNLHCGTINDNWKIDYKRLRVYLADKYRITEAYYFLGHARENQSTLYTYLRQAGFAVIFKEHTEKLATAKKGNVDADIVFEVMKNIIETKDLKNVVLISGDGDYKKLVDYLIEKNLFKKILFPNKMFASSLYKKLGSEFFDYLYNIKSYIEYKPRKITETKENKKGS